MWPEFLPVQDDSDTHLTSGAWLVPQSYPQFSPPTSPRSAQKPRLCPQPALRTTQLHHCLKNRQMSARPHGNRPMAVYPKASHTVIHRFCAKAHVARRAHPPSTPPGRPFISPTLVIACADHVRWDSASKKAAYPGAANQVPIIKGSSSSTPQLPTELSTVFVGKFCLVLWQYPASPPPTAPMHCVPFQPPVCRHRPRVQKAGSTSQTRISTGFTALPPPPPTTLSTVFVSKPSPLAAPPWPSNRPASPQHKRGA